MEGIKYSINNITSFITWRGKSLGREGSVIGASSRNIMEGDLTILVLGYGITTSRGRQHPTNMSWWNLRCFGLILIGRLKFVSIDFKLGFSSFNSSFWASCFSISSIGTRSWLNNSRTYWWPSRASSVFSSDVSSLPKELTADTMALQEASEILNTFWFSPLQSKWVKTNFGSLTSSEIVVQWVQGEWEEDWVCFAWRDM